MKTLLRTLFLSAVIFKMEIPLSWGGISIKINFPEAFDQIEVVEEVLARGIAALSKSEEYFFLSISDKSDPKTWHWKLLVGYQNGKFFLTGEFDKVPSLELIKPYCSALANIFLLFTQCGYSVEIIEQVEQGYVSKSLVGSIDVNDPESIIF